MAIQEVRAELIQHDYIGLRNALNALMDRMDGYEAALLGLTEAVSENSERISALETRVERLEEAVAENRELIPASQLHLGELNGKMDRLMAHLDVPPKPPAGFIKD